MDRLERNDMHIDVVGAGLPACSGSPRMLDQVRERSINRADAPSTARTRTAKKSRRPRDIWSARSPINAGSVFSPKGFSPKSARREPAREPPNYGRFDGPTMFLRALRAAWRTGDS
jgi:hypothetical protein